MSRSASSQWCVFQMPRCVRMCNRNNNAAKWVSFLSQLTRSPPQSGSSKQPHRRLPESITDLASGLDFASIQALSLSFFPFFFLSFSPLPLSAPRVRLLQTMHSACMYGWWMDGTVKTKKKKKKKRAKEKGKTSKQLVVALAAAAVVERRSRVLRVGLKLFPPCDRRSFAISSRPEKYRLGLLSQ